MRVTIDAKEFQKVVADWKARGELGAAGIVVAQAAAGRYAELENTARETLSFLEAVQKAQAGHDSHVNLPRAVSGIELMVGGLREALS